MADIQDEPQGLSYQVAFSEITFTKNGDNLVSTWVEDDVNKRYTYEKFFTDEYTGKDYIWTNDTGTGPTTKHVIKDDALIILTVTTPTFTGSDYNEKFTAIKATQEQDKYEGPNNAGSYIGVEGDTRLFVSKVDGGKGNDVITGTDSDDWLEGGEGNDTIYGGTGIDMLAGNTGDDVIYAGSLKDDGTIEYNTSNVEIYGDTGKDTIYSGKGNDFIWAGKDNDTIHLNGGSNTLVFYESDFGNDVVYGATGSDTLKLSMDDGTGLSGNKFSDLSFSRTVSEEGLSNDLVITSGRNTITLKDFFKSGNKLSDQLDKLVTLGYDENNNPCQETHSIINDAVIEITGVTDYEGYNVYDETTQSWVGYKEKITASDDNATIYGNIGDDEIYGGAGNDYINGSEGDDIIYAGGDGKDVISGDIGNDTIYGSAKNYKAVELYGGSGDDKIYDGAGNDFVWAGEGNDEIHLANKGKNTLVFVENNFGDDIIYDSSINDILKFALKYKDGEGEKITQGYHYNNDTFKFDIIEHEDANSDLKITLTYTDNGDNKTENTVTIKDFYNSQLDKFIALNEQDELETYSMLDFIAIDRKQTPNKKGVITGTDYADIINGADGKKNTIKAKSGNDIITAKKGNDKIYAGAGKNDIYFYRGDGIDTVYSDKGSDYLIFKGFDNADSFYMSESGKNLVINYGENDKVILNNFLKGNHSVKGFSVIKDDETVVYSKDFTSEHIDIDMSKNNKKTFKGSKLDEKINGTAENNTIKGGGGNDIIYANSGDNKIYTQSRKDDFAAIYTGSGKDTITAGNGVDTIIFNDGTCNDTVIANTKGSVVLDVSNLSNLSFKEVGKNLVITNTYENDDISEKETITIKNYLNGKTSENVCITQDGAYIYTLKEYLSLLQKMSRLTLELGDKTSDKSQKINGTFLDETIYGGTNKDTIKTGYGSDYVFGNTGNDKIYGDISKSHKKYKYDDINNSKNFIFNSTGDGKDIIYNSKHSDVITLLTEDKASALELLDNLNFEENKKNLVISYKKDAVGNVTDSITLSNYKKLDSETQAIKDIVISDYNGNIFATIDLTQRNTDSYMETIKNEVAGWTLSAPNSMNIPTLTDVQNTDIPEIITYFS